jgi:uncharacterized protein YfbU (UPF0304 family)
VEFKKVEFSKFEKNTKESSFDSSLELLEKYADLLKKGILTQQEFDLKKKEILGL